MAGDSPSRRASFGAVRDRDSVRLTAAGLLFLAISVVLPVLLFGPFFGTGDTARLQAVLTYAGVMLTTSVTVIGMAIKWQSDKRIAADKAKSDERLAADKAEQFKQIKLDAAMRAGQLLSANESGPAHPAAIASGLLALTRLGQADLAVTLLVDLWPGTEGPAGPGTVSSETAILVIDAALSSDSRNAQLVAAEMLCRNCGVLKPGQSLNWPSSLEGRWIPQLSHRAKLLIVEALVGSTLHCTADETTLRSAAVRLYGIWSGDHEPRVRHCIGKMIGALTPRLRHLHYTEFIQGDRMITMTQLEHAAKSASDTLEKTDGYLDQLSTTLAENLKTWAGEASGLYLGPGCLGAVEHSSHEIGQLTITAA
jgi:hypothetical protein